MINLAGHESPDPIVEEELFVAGVGIVRADEPQNGEVKTRISGRLGNITFTRAWYYWIVKGDVPIEVARKIYAQEPYGKRDVRVAGHCGCPPPEEPWVEHRDASGKQISVPTESNRDLFRQYHAGVLDVYLTKVIREMFEKIVFVDTEEERKLRTAASFVTSYHIDSQAGLKVFVDAVRTPEKPRRPQPTSEVLAWLSERGIDLMPFDEFKTKYGHNLPDYMCVFVNEHAAYLIEHAAWRAKLGA